MEYSLFPEIKQKNVFPSTRYQGSKSKFVDWIWNEISPIEFSTVLDAFGGTGSVAYRLKDEGKQVTYNDILPFNFTIGKAIIENDNETITDVEVNDILTEKPGIIYPSVIADNFKDIYYTDEENHWLDVVRYNIANIDDEYKRSLAWFALFQSCIIKRPYNLFHRKNLYVRMSDVERSFGNKKTWDTPFEQHFRNFIEEANRAIFSNGVKCVSLNQDALDITNKFDLVYIDTPYLNSKGIGVDYADFYHFLNGLLCYDNWINLIDYKSKHHRLKRSYSIWNDKARIINGFERLIQNFKHSTIVFSYRSNGIPSIESILHLLNNQGRYNEVKYSGNIKYALSDTTSREVLIISYPKD
ncbi:MAG: DNA adenine methylase [Muribaculum sp.]|nr:DNA adenine methylase [Muribaculum sp.]